MNKPNGPVILTPEEVEGLEGLRARVREIDKLGQIHPWLCQYLGNLTPLQIALRANQGMAALLNNVAEAPASPPTQVMLARTAILVVHLAGAIQVDLLALINMEMKAEEIRRAGGDTAVRA